MLKINGFNQRVLENLNRFKEIHKNDEPHSHYAVFDCDGTLFYGDTAYTTLENTINNLNLLFNAEDLIKEFFPLNRINANDQETINLFLKEHAYLKEKRFLSRNLDNYKRKTLWQNDPLFIDFKRNLYKLFDISYALNGYEDASYLMVSFFSGFSLKELTKLALLAFKNNDICLQNKDFKVNENNNEINNLTSLQPIMEMRNFIKELLKIGMDVYITSASPLEIVKAALSYYKFPSEIEVFGIGNTINKEGYISLKRDKENYPCPIKMGKAFTIKNMIAPRHQNQGPSFVAGDSEGDVAFLTSFKDTEISLFLGKNTNKETSPLFKAIDYEQIQNLNLIDTLNCGDILFLSQGKDSIKRELISEERCPEKLNQDFSMEENFSSLKKIKPYLFYLGYKKL